MRGGREGEGWKKEGGGRTGGGGGWEEEEGALTMLGWVSRKRWCLELKALQVLLGGGHGAQRVRTTAKQSLGRNEEAILTNSSKSATYSNTTSVT